MPKLLQIDTVLRARHSFYYAIIALSVLLCILIFILMEFSANFLLISKSKKPNIILIIADDLGWNDIGFHGSNEIPTPNIDALAYHGAILNRHYTQSVCTPSRAALLTGKYPIRMGMQGGPLPSNIRVSLPLNETLLPQYLKKQGYSTGLVGKWHLGYYNNASTPNNRGYDSFFGYYGGWVRYNDSRVTMRDLPAAYDARRNFQPAGDEFADKYDTDVFTDEAVRIISSHDSSKPLFLQVAFTAVHAIWGDGLQVRDLNETEKRFAYINSPKRRLFAGVLSALDESVGKIIQSLDDNGLLENSIVLFTSDNGGKTSRGQMPLTNYGSNWPMRGMKGSILEGAVHCAAAIWSPHLQQNVVLSNLMHLSDWVPTFNHIAGGNEVPNIDGVNQWEYLTGIRKEEPRTELLVNIDEKKGSAALISGDWKLVRYGKNDSQYHYYGYSGRNVSGEYDMDAVLSSPTHRSLSKYDKRVLSEADFWRSRNAAIIDDMCAARLNPTEEKIVNAVLPCLNTTCLFNLKDDACEFTDLSGNHTSKLKELNEVLKVYEAQLVKQWSANPDPASDPRKHGGYLTPWV